MTGQELFEKVFKEMASLEEYPCTSPYALPTELSKKTKKVLKDIDDNRNHSWIKEIWNNCVSDNRLDDTAIVYRGHKFSYKTYFVYCYRYACSLKTNGFQKGQEIVCAIENTPEFPFIMGAVSMLGGKVNLVSAEFDRDYLVEILDRADSQFVFVSDMSFAKFSAALKETHASKIIIPVPLDHSLKHGNPFADITDRYYKLDDEEYRAAVSEFDNIVDLDDFLRQGSKYKGKVIESAGLNDEFTITYTSGSTGWGKPKALIHRVRSYITMGRYHDPKVSGIPSMKGRTTLALIKTMSDTNFMTNISDTFMQGGIVALEPINDVDYFLTSMIINKAEFVIASRSFWLYAMKQQMSDPAFKDIHLPHCFCPCSVGEPLPASEEYALNRWLRKMHAGIAITKVPFVVISTGGGDSEHGGIFISIFRAYQNLRPSHYGIKEPIGMTTYDMVQVKALRKDRTYCGVMEEGRLVANSPCTMEGYLRNDEANRNFFIKDAYGKTWGDLGTYGYIDKTGHIYVKGRIGKDDGPIPHYRIQDAILKDVKRILSCEVVKEGDSYIAHLEPQPGRSFDEDQVLKDAAERCRQEFGRDFVNSLYFRVHSNKEGFPLLHTGKRNPIALQNEGICKSCIKANVSA